MKKPELLTCLLLFVLIASMSFPMREVKAAQQISFQINSVPFVAPKGEPAPYINKEQRTMIPIRFFAEALGVPNDEEHIGWNQATETATIMKDEIEVHIKLGQRFITVNGERVDMDTAAEIKNQRTFIPARFMAEALGYKVVWDGTHQTVHIMSVNDESMLYQDYQVTTHYSSPYYYDARDGKLYFKDEAIQWINQEGESEIIVEAFNNHLLNEKLNPQINQQVFDLTLALLDETHYTETRYLPGLEPLEGRVFVKYALGEGWAYNNNQNLFFIFNEQKPMLSPLGNNSFMRMNVSTFYPPDRIGKGELIEPYYENKLRAAFVALFGEQNGIDIHNYIMQEYVRTHTLETYDNRFEDSHVFKNIRVEYNNENRPFFFYFSYIKGDQ